MRVHPSSLLLACLVLLGAPRADAFTVYRGGGQQAPGALAAFTAAAGPDLLTEDFEAIPTDQNGLAGLSNGDTVGPATFFSLSLAADIDLTFGGSPSGVLGTFLIAPRAPENTLDVRPGGGGAIGTPEDDDDFRIAFSPPLQAVGILIIGNTTEAGETIRVLSGNDVIATDTLVGGGNSGEGFWGVVLELGEGPITALEVDEGSNLNDDIAFDNLAYLLAPPIPLPAWSLVGLALAIGLVFGAGTLQALRRAGGQHG